MNVATVRRCILSLVALLLIAAVPSASAQVLKVVLDDTINPVTEEFLARALTQAKETKAQAVLIEINTPGGLVDSTRGIIEKFFASPIPIIVYVTPSGSRSASAGFFILEASDVAAMAPGTNTGAAHPVMGGGEKMDDVMKTKVENDLAAFMRSIAAKRARNIDVAESAVRESKSFTEQEALDKHLIDYVAPTEEDLFKQIAAKPIHRFDGSTATLDLTKAVVVPFEMNFRQRLLDLLLNPNITFGLIAVGLFALYAEFNHPGAILPGVVGIICLLMGAFALHLLPVRLGALALLVLAFVLFALEAKFVTHGLLTVAGIVLLTIGGILLVDAPIPEMRVHLFTALAVSIPVGLITAFLMSVALRARRNKVVTGVQGMIGELGVARTALVPEGKVFVHGELWNAVSTIPVPAGTQVVVRSMEGLQLWVAPSSQAAPAELSAPV